MALQKTIKYKGYDLNYLVITQLTYDKQYNRTTVVLSGFKDEETRKLNINNVLGYTKNFTFEGFLTIEEAYDKIVESKKEPFSVEPAQPAIYKDEISKLSGEPTGQQILVKEAVPEVTELRETNEFVDAIKV